MTTLDGPVPAGPWGRRLPSPSIDPPLESMASAEESLRAAEMPCGATARTLESIPVLAPLLPLLLLVAVCVAGMTDPPASRPGHPGQQVSRLHIQPSPPPVVLRSQTTHDLPGHGLPDAPR